MTGCRGTNVRRMQQGILIRIVVRSTTGLEDPSSRRVVRSPTRDRAVERHLGRPRLLMYVLPVCSTPAPRCLLATTWYVFGLMILDSALILI
jgi:hypothetical protein